MPLRCAWRAGWCLVAQQEEGAAADGDEEDFELASNPDDDVLASLARPDGPQQLSAAMGTGTRGSTLRWWSSQQQESSSLSMDDRQATPPSHRRDSSASSSVMSMTGLLNRTLRLTLNASMDPELRQRARVKQQQGRRRTKRLRAARSSSSRGGTFFLEDDEEEEELGATTSSEKKKRVLTLKYGKHSQTMQSAALARHSKRTASQWKLSLH